MQIEMDIREDLSERVSYNIPEFPAYVRRGILSSYTNFSAISHWHDDLEFILVWSGNMEYNVNGTIVTLHEGEGIFVNTRQLHYGFSKNFEECIFLCIRVHPILLCSSPYVERNYVMPVIENECMPYLVLHPDNEQDKALLKMLDKIYHFHHDDLFPLKIQGVLFQMWEKLFLLSNHTGEQPAPKNLHLTLLKDMIRFIYGHYSEKISLFQISNAGKVGKTTCCSIFQKYTNETPFSYLTNYRLKKGIELLETTDKTISEICFEVGFSSASYFAETFRKNYGCTPTEYRRIFPKNNHLANT